jgi:hypothetical protein
MLVMVVLTMFEQVTWSLNVLEWLATSESVA